MLQTIASNNSRRLASLGLASMILALTLAGTEKSVSGVDGTGRHAGSAQHTTKQQNPRPCALQSIEYEGVGIAEVKQGRITYFGPIRVKYSVPEGWGNPNGSISPYSNDAATACGDGDEDNPNFPDGPTFGPSAVTRASMEGSNPDGFSLRCGWSEGTYDRRVTQEELIFPAGGAFPSEGSPGTCTIDPPVGQTRTSNTRVKSAGLQAACEGVFAPLACQHDYQMTATTEGPIPAEPPPVVSSVAANSLPQGTAHRTITIAGEEFDASPETMFSGTGITVHSTRRDSFTALTATISIGVDAPVGPRDLVVVNGDGTSGACASCFQVTAGPPPPPPQTGSPPFVPSAGSAPVTSGPPGNTASGDASSGVGGIGSGTTSAPAPAAPPAQVTMQPPAPPSAAPPGGGPGPPAGAPATSLVPGALPVHAPGGGLAASFEESGQSAPQGGVRVMMTGLPAEERWAFVFVLLGFLMLVGCAFQWRTRSAFTQPSISPAAALGLTR